MRQKLGNRLWSGFFGSLAFAVVTMGLLQAQVPTATLTGVVKDSTGAVVPNVKVTAINTDTNLSRRSGHRYVRHVSHRRAQPGTLPARRKGERFQESHHLRHRARSRPAGARRCRDAGRRRHPVPEVTGTASLVNTESNLIGGVINQSRVVRLPLNGRNFMELDHADRGHR